MHILYDHQHNVTSSKSGLDSYMNVLITRLAYLMFFYVHPNRSKTASRLIYIYICATRVYRINIIHA